MNEVHEILIHKYVDFVRPRSPAGENLRADAVRFNRTATNHKVELDLLCPFLFCLPVIPFRKRLKIATPQEHAEKAMAGLFDTHLKSEVIDAERYHPQRLSFREFCNDCFKLLDSIATFCNCQP